MPDDIISFIKMVYIYEIHEKIYYYYYVYIVSFKMFRERERRIFNDAQYRVHTSPELFMLSIPHDLIDIQFHEDNTFTSTPGHYRTFYRSGPRPSPPWSDDEKPHCPREGQIYGINMFARGFFCERDYDRQEGHNENPEDILSGQPPPTFQYVVEGRIEKRIVDPEIPPLNKEPAEHTEGPYRFRPNSPSVRPSDTVWEVRRRQRTQRDRSRSPPNIFTSDDKNYRGISGLKNAKRRRGILVLNNAPRGR